MAYPNGTVPTDVPVHPTPVYETIVMGIVTRACCGAGGTASGPGNLFALWAVLAGAERFLVEFIRRNEEVVAGLTQPQLISIAMMLAGGAWIATHRGPAPAAQPRRRTPARRTPARVTAIMPRRMAAATAHVLPEASEIRDGRLLIGGCDAEALAREHGTPAYVFAEDDLRARARAFTGALAAAPRRAGRGRVRLQGAALHARAARCSPRRGWAATSPRAASCTWRCTPASRPSASTCTATPSRAPSCAMALEAGVGTIVLDNAEEARRLSELLGGRAPARAAAGHARRRRGHPRGDPHRARPARSSASRPTTPAR